MEGNGRPGQNPDLNFTDMLQSDLKQAMQETPQTDKNSDGRIENFPPADVKD